MSILTFSSINDLSFHLAKELINAFPVQAVAASGPKRSHKKEEDNKAKVLTCKCCKWQGKDTEAKTEVFFLENTTELELYCPKCNSYLGFHK